MQGFSAHYSLRPSDSTQQESDKQWDLGLLTVWAFDCLFQARVRKKQTNAEDWKTKTGSKAETQTE